MSFATYQADLLNLCSPIRSGCSLSLSLSLSIYIYMHAGSHSIYRWKMGWPIFIKACFLLAQPDPMRTIGQNGSKIKILKLIINNNFINFILYKIKFFCNTYSLFIYS